MKSASSTFAAEVLKSRQPVLVHFSTDWSLRSIKLAPVLEEIARECGDRIKVARVDLDANVDLGLSYGIQFIPTLLYFVNGQVRDRIMGPPPRKPYCPN